MPKAPEGFLISFSDDLVGDIYLEGFRWWMEKAGGGISPEEVVKNLKVQLFEADALEHVIPFSRAATAFLTEQGYSKKQIKKFFKSLNR